MIETPASIHSFQNSLLPLWSVLRLGLLRPLSGILHQQSSTYWGSNFSLGFQRPAKAKHPVTTLRAKGFPAAKGCFMRHSNRFRAAVWLFLLLVFHTSEVEAQNARQATVKKSCLWRVVSRDSTVYLLGSVHLLKSGSYPLSDAMERAFGDSSKLVLEVNLDSLDSPDAQQMILAKALLPEGKTLTEILSPATYQAVQQKVEALGLDIEALKRMKPWFLSLSLVAMKMQQLGYNAQHGVDRHFFERARKAKKDVLGLETADFQLNLLDSLPAKAQEESLLQTMKELDQFETEFEEIMSAWAAGQEKQLNDLLLASFKEYPDIYEKLILERNRNWLPKIESHLQGGNKTLVVVGAAHLVGHDGVVELLKQKGYSVEQL
jgi:uncharacterized protein